MSKIAGFPQYGRYSDIFAPRVTKVFGCPRSVPVRGKSALLKGRVTGSGVISFTGLQGAHSPHWLIGRMAKQLPRIHLLSTP
jgi:hypothetical protein